MESINIYLIRHGETGQVISKPNANITSEGKRDIEKLSQLFSDNKIKFDAIYYSDLIRVKETVGIILDKQQCCEKLETNNLCERDFGEKIYNLSEHEQKEFLRLYTLEQEKDLIKKFGFESTESLFNRAIKVKKEILKNHFGKNIAVVSSGGFLPIFEYVLNNLSVEDYKIAYKENLKSILDLVLKRGEYKLLSLYC